MIKVIDHKEFYDFYRITDTLGKGQYGIVRLGYNIETNQEVAVKIVKKANMRTIEIF